MTSTLTLIRRTLKLLNKNDRKKLYLAIPISAILGLLDLVGVILLGTVGTFAYKNISGDQKPTRLEIILRDLPGFQISENSLIILLSGLAVLTLMLKTVCQLIFYYRYAKFMARQEAEISVSLFRKILSGNSYQTFSTNLSQYQYSLITGPGRLVNTVLNGLISIMTDGINVILLCGLAFFVSPSSFIAASGIFLLVFLSFNRFINSKADYYGGTSQEFSVGVHETVLESIRGFKELKVYKKELQTLQRFSSYRFKLSEIYQKSNWLGSLMKYIFEIAILLSAVCVSVLLVNSRDPRQIVTIIVIFMAMGFRLIPGIQRLQNSFIGFRIAKGATSQLFELFDKYEGIDEHCLRDEERRDGNSLELNDLNSIVINDVTLKVRNGLTEKEILSGINLTLAANQIIGIVGKSGAGKTSLADLIIGINSPTSGSIKFLGQNGEISIDKIRRGYVNQSPVLYGTDLVLNVAFGSDQKKIDYGRIKSILNDLGLTHLIASEEDYQVKSLINSDGSNISGGERQRIAIARAIYANSQLIVFDEPSSALDSANQESLMKLFDQLRKTCTIIVITHSEKFIDYCDKILVIEKGRIQKAI
jgi:ABC-type multidrug transport system fused ATPase/permease subunit